jgi:hypothetical protein
LKCIVQNNVFEVEKLKDVQKTNFFENTLPCAVVKRTANIYVCRASKENAWKRYMFAVRFWTAHGKGNDFAVRLTLTHGKGDEQPNRVNIPLGKKCLPCATMKTHGKLFVCRAPT